MRIDRGVVDPDFIVQMGTGTAAAQTDKSDGVAAVYSLAGGYREVGQVTVARGDAMAVVQRNGPSVAAQKISKSHGAVGGRDYRLAIRRCDVDAAMERTFTVKRGNALAKRPGNWTFHRPKIRSRIGPDPVSRSHVAGEAKRNPGHRGAAKRRSSKSIKLVQRRVDLRVLDA